MSVVKRSLNHLVLDYLLKEIGRAGCQVAAQWDIPGEVLLKLKRLSLEQRELFLARACCCVEVRLDFSCVEATLRGIDAHTQDDDRQNEFLLAGAPLGLMRLLFGMHATEFSLRRRALGMSGKNRGRPAADEQLERDIWIAWKAAAQLSLQSRFLQTAEVAGASLVSVWATLKKHEAQELEVGKAHVRAVPMLKKAV